MIPALIAADSLRLGHTEAHPEEPSDRKAIPKFVNKTSAF